MLRMIFVVTIIIAGVLFSLLGPFQGLLFYIWNAYFRPEWWVHSRVLFAWRLSLIIGIYVCVRTILLRPNPQLGWRTALIWLFLLQTAICTYTSESYERSWITLDIFARVMVITYVIVVLVTDHKKFRLVLLVMTLSLGFETSKQGWANLFRNPGGSNTNPVAFLGDNNGVALGMMMLLPLIGALIQTSKTVWERSLHRVVGFGVLLRGIATYSRGGFLGAATLAVIMIVRAEHKIRAAIVVGALSLFIYNLMPASFWNRMDTIQVEDNQERDESSASRLHFWSVAVEMAAAKPLTGVGFNGFASSFPDYNTDSRFAGEERAAHSIWFGTLGDLGYPGLLLFILNFGTAFWSCWRAHRITKGRKDLRELRIFGNALISSLVVFCVGGSFLSHQYNEMAWHLVALSTALHLTAARQAAEAPVLERPQVQVA